MKVFISWSGDLSRSLAVELCEWLPMVVQQVEPWISGRDIDPGQRWALILARELEQSDFAVICLTPENRNSAWILFEAGAVARSLEARVVPLLMGLQDSELDGPLSQFQSVSANEAGIRKLVTILFDASGSGLAESKQKTVFAKLWPIFEERLSALTEQWQRKSHVLSGKDLIDDLTKSSYISLDVDGLERLNEERERLSRELAYLYKEEDELTRQDAPISLEERAIVPTKHRLNQVQITLKESLDRVFGTLKPSQVDILRTIVASSGRANEATLWRYGREDVEDLARRKLLRITPNDLVMTHPVVGEYLLTM